MSSKQTVLCVLAFLVLPAVSVSDVVVTRLVEADEFVSPTRVGGAGHACPGRLSKPRSGESVRLSIRPDMARRDEPGLSVIVNRGDQRAYILHHSTSTYSEISIPARIRDLESSHRASMGPAAREFFSYNANGDVRFTRATVSEREVSRRSLSVSSSTLRRRDVAADIAPDTMLGKLAFEVESLGQAIRAAGEEWMSLLGNPDGVPLSMSESIHLLESIVTYSEVFSGLETQVLDPRLFGPPEDYARVDHVPDCFYSPY